MANENDLTGKFDVVAEFGLETVNRVLAAQHQAQTYLHSIPADNPAEDLLWVRIDDEETGVRGLAQMQVSTPTVSLPEGEDASRVTIHYQLMARIQADPERESSIPWADTSSAPTVRHQPSAQLYLRGRSSPCFTGSECSLAYSISPTACGRWGSPGASGLVRPLNAART